MQTKQDFEHHELTLIRDFVWQKCGLYFESSKQRYFTRRVLRRMESLKCPTFMEYYRFLTSNHAQSELTELLNLLTTTETYFFRNKQQLDAFEEEVVPTFIKRKRAAHAAYFHLWSAGCSSGEEPYTLAMILLETLPEIEQWKISIVGTDINTQALAKAREGIYPARSLRDVPHKYRVKYFVREGEHYHIAERVKRMVSFRPGNLANQHDAALLQNLDCIFCRNVLIYFNLEAQRTVVQMFYEHLARNGYLFLGHSESLYRITTIFKLVKLQNSLVYYKE